MLRRRRAAQINRQSIPYGMENAEYLESSGTEYIDTNLTGTNLSTFGKIAALSGTGGSGAFLYGTTDCHYRITSYAYSTGDWGCHWCLSQPETTTLWGGMIGNLSYGTIVNCDLDMDKKTVTVTSPSTTLTSVSTITSPYLEGIYNNFRIGWASSNSKCRFYELKCKKTGVTIAHFIPTLDRTGTPCMFDKVTRKRFYNAGTGEFGYPRPNNIPSNYTQVEYLESTGTQWIDTLCHLNDNVEVQTELQYTNFLYNSDQVNWFYGNYSSQTKYVLWGLYDYLNRGWAVIGNLSTGINIPSGCTLFDRFIVEHTKDFIKLNGKVCDIWGESTFIGDPALTKTLYLFARHHKEGYAQTPVSGKMWYFKVLYDGIVSNNFVPCLDQTGTPCMYDTVTQTTYYNAGTGDFLYPSPTSAATYSMRRPQAEYAKMTDTGVRRLYHVPVDYDGSIEEYANEHGFKLLNETESPNEEGKYYAFRWIETETELGTEWYEIEPPTDELGNPIENTDEPQVSTFGLRRPTPIDETVYTNTAKWAMMTDTGVRRLYKTPKDYEGSLEDYAIQYGYKQLVETESPNEEGKNYSFRWVETDDTLTTEWFEVEPQIEENL